MATSWRARIPIWSKQSTSAAFINSDRSVMQSLQMDCILSHLRYFLCLKASLPLQYGPLSLTAPLNWRSLLLEAFAVHVLHCVTCFSVVRGPESFKGSCRLQGSVYVILPPTTAIIGYVIGFQRLVALSPTTAITGYIIGFQRLVTLSPNHCHNWLHHRFPKTSLLQPWPVPQLVTS